MDCASLEQAAAVCAKSLRANISEFPGTDGRSVRLLRAGGSHFGSIRTRDACFAAGGLLAAGESDCLRGTLEEIFSRQRADGRLPRVVDSWSPLAPFARFLLGKRLPFARPLAGNFTSENFVPSIDANAAAVWAACVYAVDGDQPAWAGLILPKLELAMAWYGRRAGDGLITQAPRSDWKDTVSERRGCVFFTQLLRWKAQMSLAGLHEFLGRRSAAAQWKSRARAVQRLVHQAFWDAERGYFRDTLKRPEFSADGNFAAAAWGFCSEEEAARILRASDKLGLWTPWGPRAAQPYKTASKSLLTLTGGLPGYHDDFVWLWTTALALNTLRILGRDAQADAVTQAVAGLLVKSGRVAEVYRPDTGAEVRTWAYSAEAPFSWSAGMMLETLQPALRTEIA